jgi:hypothetical protein
MDWQPSDAAKGKELIISLLQAGGFYARAAPDAIAHCAELKDEFTAETQRTQR